MKKIPYDKRRYTKERLVNNQTEVFDSVFGTWLVLSTLVNNYDEDRYNIPKSYDSEDIYSSGDFPDE